MSSLPLPLARRRSGGSLLSRVGRLLAYLILTVLAVSMAVPLLWMISTSLKDNQAVFAVPPTWVPNPPHWSNYAQVFQVVPFALFGLNSLKISSLATLGTLVSCSMAAFAFARLRFPGRGLLFAVLLSVLMIPSQVTLIPVYYVMAQLGWINTHYPLIVPAWFGNAFGIFLLRQFFLTLPQELMDAAKIDGCTPYGVYARIWLPLAKPALATLAILTFINSWNDFLSPLIYLNDQSMMTIPVGLASFQGLHNADWGPLMAAAFMGCVPMIVLFVAGQRYFVQGIVLSGLKG
jgi:ABC-type glycerol-3-phosphate transport system permease component